MFTSLLHEYSLAGKEMKPVKYRMEIQILFSKYYLFLRAWIMLGLGKPDYENKFISLPSCTHSRLLCLPYEQQSYISLYLPELPINFHHNPSKPLCAAAASFIANGTLDTYWKHLGQTKKSIETHFHTCNVTVFLIKPMHLLEVWSFQ